MSAKQIFVIHVLVFEYTAATNTKSIPQVKNKKNLSQLAARWLELFSRYTSNALNDSMEDDKICELAEGG